MNEANPFNFRTLTSARGDGLTDFRSRAVAESERTQRSRPGGLPPERSGLSACLDREPKRAAWLQLFNNLPANERYGGARHLFNRFLRDYCERHNTFTFIDVDNLTTADDVFDPDPNTGEFLPDHLTRRGYIAIAARIAECLAPPKLAGAA